jgi:hypothetical protein
VYLFVTQDKPSLLAKTQETMKNTLFPFKSPTHPQPSRCWSRPTPPTSWTSGTRGARSPTTSTCR